MSIMVSIAFCGLVLLLGFQNCSPQATHFATDLSAKTVTPTVIVDGGGKDDGDSTIICDPFNSGIKCSADSKVGLIGNIYYLNPSQANLFADNSMFNARLPDYYHYGTKIDVPIVMSQFNIANRSFLSGFVIAKGANGEDILATDGSGKKLVEWFAIRLTGQIMVDAADEGLYQFAVNSDDGSKIFIDNKLLIDNGEGHPEVRMESTDLVWLVRNTKQPIEIQYFQGPAEYIALEVFVRKCEVPGVNNTCQQFGDWKVLPSKFLSHE